MIFSDFGSSPPFVFGLIDPIEIRSFSHAGRIREEPQSMNSLPRTKINNCRILLQGMCPFAIFLMFFLFSGCSIWNAALDPDYKSSRAERLCHPYGQCSQGTWVAHNGVEQDSTIAKNQCEEVVAQRYGNGEWEESVAKGLEISRCMEKKGYKLQQ